MAPCLDAADIAYALHSVSTTGGTAHDADILEAVLGCDASPDLNLIRSGLATPQVADELARTIWH